MANIELEFMNKTVEQNEAQKFIENVINNVID